MAIESSPEGTFRFFLEEFRSPGWMKTELSSGFFGITIGATADEAVESWILACRAHLLLDPESPDDVLPYIAQDRRLMRFSTETAAQHRDRLWRAWDIYLTAGTEEVIESQLFEAGWGPTELLGEYGSDVDYGSDFVYADRGAYVDYRINEPGPRGEPPPYRTQFWLVFNEGFHPITGDPTAWGDFDWGDISEGVWAYEGYSNEFAIDIRGIVKKWKNSEYAFRGFTFIMNALDYGGDVTYGSDVIYGGRFEFPVYF